MNTPTEGGKPDIMGLFPLDKPRNSQEVCIREIQKAFDSGARIVILEAPVGSGKSALAINLARYAELDVGGGGSHIITPRKALQDQYYGDFQDHVVLMKGRNAYPCTMDSTPAAYKKVIKLIEEGRIDQPRKDFPDCATAPCVGEPDIYKMCTESRPCPYTVAMELAQDHTMVVHNLHSFIFQASFRGKFEERGLLVIDEAHEVESTVRSFLSKKIYLPGNITRTQIAALDNWGEWKPFLLKPEFVPEETDYDVQRKAQDPKYKSEKQEYLETIARIGWEKKDTDNEFSVELTPDTKPRETIPWRTALEFVPHSVGGAVQSMLLSFGKKVLLMSGTIYDKANFCKNLGIDPAQARFIKVGSSFPKADRPIYCLSKYQVDTSHANWNENFDVMIEKIREISSVFHDVKGLIHAPSYMAGEQIRAALGGSRFVTHQPRDFQERLTEFYADEEPKIFISPVCQQGVDFKDDRARFQIIIRVPYANTSSAFVSDKLKKDFPWYNYQSLVVFGQQIGRINRSAGDYGATFLLDERFNRYLARNGKVLPKWVKEAIVWKT